MNADRELIELDMRGQICPSCLLMALKQVNEKQDGLRSGQAVLHILTDDRQATNTIPNAVVNMGYIVDIEKIKDFYTIKISFSN